jgi:CheY-like chemotaxis protein
MPRGAWIYGGDPPRPSLIVLDLNIPGLDGRDVLIEIKRDDCLRGIPVVIFTSSSNRRDIVSCYGDGANSIQVKPFEAPVFQQVVRDMAHYWMQTAVLA